MFSFFPSRSGPELRDSDWSAGAPGLVQGGPEGHRDTHQTGKPGRGLQVREMGETARLCNKAQRAGKCLLGVRFCYGVVKCLVRC